MRQYIGASRTKSDGVLRHIFTVVLQISTSETKQAIASLFEVTDLFTRSNDGGMKAEMMEKKKVYGTLLQSLDLVNMSKDSVEEKIMPIKSGLYSKVRITSCTIALPTTLPFRVSYPCNHFNLITPVCTCNYNLYVPHGFFLFGYYYS